MFNLFTLDFFKLDKLEESCDYRDVILIAYNDKDKKFLRFKSSNREILKLANYVLKYIPQTGQYELVKDRFEGGIKFIFNTLEDFQMFHEARLKKAVLDGLTTDELIDKITGRYGI